MKSKKRALLLPMACLLVILFASCDSKLCYCYQPTASGVQETQVYVNSDTPCSSINNNANSGCVESNERMDPSRIAWANRKQR